MRQFIKDSRVNINPKWKHKQSTRTLKVRGKMVVLNIQHTHFRNRRYRLTIKKSQSKKGGYIIKFYPIMTGFQNIVRIHAQEPEAFDEVFFKENLKVWRRK